MVKTNEQTPDGPSDDSIRDEPQVSDADSKSARPAPDTSPSPRRRRHEEDGDRAPDPGLSVEGKRVKPNAVWFKPVMFGLMLIGFLWIVVFYVSGAAYWPVPQLGQWNILVGFGILMVGFLMTTQWRS